MKNTLQEAKDIIQAIIDGKPLEYFNDKKGVWMPCNFVEAENKFPFFDTTTYRRAPKPTPRYIRVEDLPDPCWVHKGVNRWLVIAVSPGAQTVIISDNLRVIAYTPEELHKQGCQFSSSRNGEPQSFLVES